VRAASEERLLVKWVATRAISARRVASVCTGAFLLGAAGLLDGRRVATHWGECGRLAQLFPKAQVEPDPIFIQDGSLWSSAGVTAGIDLALAMVEADLGHSIAMAVARDLVVFLKRPGGQAQYSAAMTLQERDHPFDALHGWMLGHLAEDLSVAALAERAHMSERTFIRHYRAAVGVTPARSVETLRVEAARRLLESGKVPVKRVASRCGFGSEETMRRSFAKEVGVTPRDYRERFSRNPTTNR
jgi:transcriptional regulator GlxA family with amidase domain